MAGLTPFFLLFSLFYLLSMFQVIRCIYFYLVISPLILFYSIFSSEKVE